MEHVQAEVNTDLAQLPAAAGLVGYRSLLPERGKSPESRSAPQRRTLRFPERAKSLLRRSRHIADFIQQPRASGPPIRSRYAPLCRTRKAPTLVAKNRALHQRLRDR